MRTPHPRNQTLNVFITGDQKQDTTHSVYFRDFFVFLYLVNIKILNTFFTKRSQPFYLYNNEVLDLLLLGEK